MAEGRAGAQRSDEHDSEAGSRPTRRLLLLLTALMLGLLLSELDQAIFATALPTVVGELDGLGLMLWVNTSYILAGTVMMPVLGRLGDAFGRRRVFVASLLVLMLGSVIGGLAPDMITMIIGRTVQGLGGGGLLVLVQAIVADVVPARGRARVMSAIGVVFAVSAILGPLVGGWLTESVGWRWAFWINLPLGAVAVVAALALLPRQLQSGPRSGSRSGHRSGASSSADVAGIAWLTAATTAVVLIISWGGGMLAWISVPMAALVVAAVLAIVLLIRNERRAVTPLIPLHLFRRRNFVLAVCGGLALAVTMFGTVGYLPTYLQMVTGLSPTKAGMMMLALIAGLGSATVVTAQVVARTGRYKVFPVVGAALVAGALALFAALPADAGLVPVAGCLFLLGVGTGAAWELLVVVAQNTAGPDDVGVATSTNGFFRELGVLIGSAVVGAVFTARLYADRAGLEGLTPERLRTLPADQVQQIAADYHQALSPVFAALVPLAVLGAAALIMIRPVPLSTSLPSDAQPALADDRDVERVGS